MTTLAYSRPFWPLFLHVFGAMTLFGAILAATVLAAAGKRAGTFAALIVSVPAWVVMRAGAAWIKHDEFPGGYNPTWLTLGMNVADGGLIVLLILLGLSFWWRRSPTGGTGRLARIVPALCGVYLLLLALAWLAMSGKWS